MYTVKVLKKYQVVEVAYTTSKGMVSFSAALLEAAAVSVREFGEIRVIADCAAFNKEWFIRAFGEHGMFGKIPRELSKDSLSSFIFTEEDDGEDD